MKTTKTKFEPAPYPEPPAGLSSRSQELWRKLGREHAESTSRQVLFEQALKALDRADQCALAIASEGLTSVTASTGALHVHPLVKIEIESRNQFAKIWFSQLCMTVEKDPYGL